MSAPKITAIVPVENVSQGIVRPDGRYTLHQVLYDIYAPSFPARVSELAVVIVFTGGVGRFEGRLRIEGPIGDAGQSVFAFDAQASYFMQICNLAGIVLPCEGEYHLVVELEGQTVGDAPLFVINLNQPGVSHA